MWPMTLAKNAEGHCVRFKVFLMVGSAGFEPAIFSARG